VSARVHVTARPLGPGLVQLAIGDFGPHWVISTDDALRVGWALIDTANGWPLISGLDITDRRVTRGDVPPGETQ
jgi:hypothetical protein